MTTAARPTFEPARGGRGKGETDLSAISKQYSSRDLPGHLKLKYRQEGQDTIEEVRGRNLKKDLDDRERNREKRSSDGRSRDSSSSQTKRMRIEQIPTANLDADDPVDEERDSDEDSEDDTAELMAELNRIKKERAVETTRKEKEKKEEEDRIRMENILSGNPLLNVQSNFQVKRRWDDDVIFKNCAKGQDEKGANKGFINDTLRSEFHKKFMEKYIK